MDKIIKSLEKGEEDLKRGGKGWYKLKWKSIKNGTWNIYAINHTFKQLGILFSYSKNSSGCWTEEMSWDNKMFDIRIGLIWTEVNLWIKWDIIAIFH